MADNAGIINIANGQIVQVPGVLVNDGGVWKLQATTGGGGGGVPTTRQINTTSPLTGGGDLSADRTIAMPAATTTSPGYMTAAQATTLAAAQPGNANLTAIAGQTTAADRLTYWTGAATAALATLTAFGRSFIAAADAAAAKLLLALTKDDVGLSNVDNTSDATKSVLYATTAGSATDATKLPLTGGTLTGGLTIQYPEVVTYLNSTDTTLGSYLILRSNGTNIGSFQAGGTTMTAPFGDQMRIRAYRAGGGIDFAVAGSATATHRMDASSNFMSAGGGWFGKAPATTYTDTFGNCEVYYAAATGGVKCGLAAIDTTTQAAGQGGGILFGGAFNGTTVTTAAVIRAAKTNSTAGNYSFGLDFYTRLNGSGALTKAMSITDTARVGIGVSPTAMLHLPAGTATASTAPLKFTSGTLLTTPEAGAVEYLTDKAYLTIATGTARKEIALADAALTSGRIPYTTTNGRLVDSTTLAYNAGTATMTVNLSQNAQTGLQITNTNTGASGIAGIRCSTLASNATFGATSSASTYSGAVLIHTPESVPITFWNNGLRRMTINNEGKVAIGANTAITAMLHLPAGTTTANNAPLKFTSGNLLTTPEAGAVEFLTDKAYLTITTGTARKEIALADAALTTGQGVYANTNGRLVSDRRFQIYATGTTNGTAGSSVNLTAAASLANGDMRWIKLTVKAKSASIPPSPFARTLEAVWANAGGTLTQVDTDVLGTLFSSGALDNATIVSAGSATNVVITCTDVTGAGSTVTWEIFGEYC